MAAALGSAACACLLSSKRDMALSVGAQRRMWIVCEKTQRASVDGHAFHRREVHSSKIVVWSSDGSSSRAGRTRKKQGNFFQEHRRSMVVVSKAKLRISARNGAAGMKSSDVTSETKLGREEAPVIVWFKHDLRVDDHPGLVAAASASSAVPLLVLDSVALGGVPRGSLPFFRESVEALRESLRRLGSDLVVREGNAAEVISDIACQVGAREVLAEEEVEHTWRQLSAPVAAALSALVRPNYGDDGAVPGASSLADDKAGVPLVEWRALLDDPSGPDGLAAIPDSFRDYQRSSRRVVRNPPLDPPAALPPLPRSLDLDSAGPLPSLHDLERLHSRLRSADIDANVSCEARGRGAREEGGVRCEVSLEEEFRAGGWAALRAWRKKYPLSDPYEAFVADRKADEQAGEEAFAVQGGEPGAVEALRGYLRFLEPTSRSDWQRLHRAVLREEVRPGASFLALFGTAVSMGVVSRRRVYYEALQYECAQSGGRLVQFGHSSFTAKAAARAAEAGDWHQLLGLKALHAGPSPPDQPQYDTRPDGVSLQYYRWRGALVQYIQGGGSNGSVATNGGAYSAQGSTADGGAVLFVHGFGAFAEHFRENVKGLAERGCRVWSVTLPGFGRSEKPAMAYSQDLWSDFVRDFIVNVVREPVVLAGNSIGGYVTASVAADHATLVKSVVLLNSAGRVVEEPPAQTPPSSVPARNIPQAIAWVTARVLFLYLQTSSNKILRRCYPKSPDRVNQWLCNEIIRASYDPGAVEVVESAFYLPKPRPLNHLLDAYPGPVLVVQPSHPPGPRVGLIPSTTRLRAPTSFARAAPRSTSASWTPAIVHTTRRLRRSTPGSKNGLRGFGRETRSACRRTRNRRLSIAGPDDRLKTFWKCWRRKHSCRSSKQEVIHFRFPRCN